MKRENGIGCGAIWVAVFCGFVFGVHFGRRSARAVDVDACPPCPRCPIAPTLHDWGSGDWLAMKYDANARSISSVGGQVVLSTSSGELEMVMLTEQNVLTCEVPSK